jgi:hypothetical protein
MTDVADFKAAEGGYTIADVQFLQDGSRKLIEATDVTGSETQLSAGTAETAQDSGTIASTTKDITMADDLLTVGSAKTVDIEDYLFNDIGNSQFMTDNGQLTSAGIVSETDNNLIRIDDLDIYLNTGDTLKITKAGGRWDIETGGRVVDHSGQARVIDLKPGGRYEYGDFAIQNSYQDFRFCLKTAVNQTYENCNLVDLVDNIVDLKGNIQYERKGDVNYHDVIETGDSMLLQFETASVGNGHIYSGPFEVYIEDYVYYRYAMESPNVIKAVDPNIEISETTLARTGMNTFSMYAGTEQDAFIQRYEGLLP